ncbi:MULTISPECIES: carboxypeptidase-like regulatory domain-containing protein [Lysobacteraceae]|nr:MULTISPECIES: carboxypeptidase-like regulatory domain-containing protein [Lysobacter]
MSNSIKRIAFAFAATALVAFGANAQQASGNIAGTAVTGDTVLVTGTGTGFHRELKIEKDGKYQLRSVPLGEYVVSVTHADGTAETPKGVAVRAGSTARVK